MNDNEEAAKEYKHTSDNPINKYEVYVSRDKKNWTLANSGEFNLDSDNIEDKLTVDTPSEDKLSIDNSTTDKPSVDNPSKDDSDNNNSKTGDNSLIRIFLLIGCGISSMLVVLIS